ncbi:hypothetical protein NEMBOFW57_000193 [Staphylotrichum longicolle]|uniref:FAD dependent oxidoreductase domain-containing protein n=1 Tax=Staphylotrichum longicolle TaxID=669026 RepID=A0AAD4EZZ4_9PEZI|nr:hypothetical protein NEMBOFW57_000193 [Staphylotrichum longicolle]
MALSSSQQHHSFGSGQTVAVIGAGISGVCTAAHLIRQGLRVTVFERSSIAGGVWHYDEKVAEDPPYPNNTPSQGDYRVSQRGEFAYATPPPELHGDSNDYKDSQFSISRTAADLEVRFSPPGPCYAGLKNNVPTYLMASVLGGWPEGTEAFVSQKYLEEYIQSLAANTGVDAITRFRTRVDDIRKTPEGGKWEIRSVALEEGESGPRIVERHSQFDLVVVASGHYNMPRIPDIKGLKTWKTTYPERVTHSKQYRHPEKHKAQNVLIIGAGVSALDICRELDGVANKTYQSVRGGNFDLPASLLPEGVTRLPEVAEFVLRDNIHHRHIAGSAEPIPGFIVLKDGQVLDDIHHVITATGYITSYPFLPQLHSDHTPNAEATGDHLVAAEGDMAHNLHRDIFYINDPTLAFVGVPYYVATFSLFDFQAQAVARVFAGKARLPTTEEMRVEYEKRVGEKGLGRGFHSLHAVGHEVAYVQGLVDWVNEYAAEIGEPPMLPHSEEWKRGYDELKAKTTALFKTARGAGVVEKGAREVGGSSHE